MSDVRIALCRNPLVPLFLLCSANDSWKTVSLLANLLLLIAYLLSVTDLLSGEFLLVFGGRMAANCLLCISGLQTSLGQHQRCLECLDRGHVEAALLKEDDP